MKSKNIVKLLSLAMVGGLVFAACKKDKNEEVVPAQIKALTQKGWKVKDITVPQAGDGSKDSSILKACAADDSLAFSLTGSYQFSDGTTKCDSTILFYSKGNWSYDLAKDSILLGATTPAKRLSWKVLKLNDTMLQVKYIDSLVPPKKITKTISFKH